MGGIMAKVAYYLPRIIAILCVLLASVFIAEGLAPGFSLIDAVMHLAIALVVLAATVVAWKWPKIGGWLFLLLGLAVFNLNYQRGNAIVGLIAGGVPFLAGVLFLVEGFRNRHNSRARLVS
jgi:hypothetical protein